MYPQVFGKYVLERELARGGMARVVLATLRGAGGFEKKLVVKQIRDELAFDAEWVRRFVEEAKTTVSLSHPNIVPVYELGVEQGTYFLAMELVSGLTVAQLLKDGPPLTPEEGAYVGVEVCRALDYAHRRMDVVHRDVTPRNVMIDDEGQVKVIDFGIAAPSSVAGHEVFGSPGHMPPEQIEGRKLGPATDVFAVAVTLMEAWRGKAPFRRATPAACEEAMKGTHPKPSEADPRLAPLDDVIARAMALDPAARPQHADELGKPLRKFLAGVDAGDVARTLGDRVRATRARLNEKIAESTDASMRPRAPSLGDLGTKTFAARGEVSAWSEVDAAPKKKIVPKAMPTPLTPIVAINTRRLPRSVPPPAVEAAPIVEVAPAAAVPDVVIETIATQPTARAVRTKPERGRRVATVVALGVSLGIGLIVIRSRHAEPAIPTPTIDPVAIVPTGTATPTATATPTPTPNANATPTPTPNANANPRPTATATATPNANANANANADANANANANARLSLIADPGTRVSIDGTPRGPCPLRDLPLDPGTHDVRFTFDPTGESSGERVALRAGERVTIRADFSSATPTLRVQR